MKPNRYLDIGSAAGEIATALHPRCAEDREHVQRVYYRALIAAIHAGKIVAQDSVSLLPIDATHPAIAVAAVLSILRSEEINRWLAANGVPVELSDSVNIDGRNPARAAEDPSLRRERIARRRDALKSSGVRNFNEVLAREEGVSISRIQQDLKPAASRKREVASRFPGRIVRTR